MEEGRGRRCDFRLRLNLNPHPWKAQGCGTRALHLLLAGMIGVEVESNSRV
jgi:hypothetical protein